MEVVFSSFVKKEKKKVKKKVKRGEKGQKKEKRLKKCVKGQTVAKQRFGLMGLVGSR